MRRHLVAAPALAALLALAVAPARAEGCAPLEFTIAAPAPVTPADSGPALAPRIVVAAPADGAPVRILAQRALDRDWGPPAGVTPPAPPPGLVSEGRALALSAALPGAGQLYAQQMSGLWFALAEVAGWSTHWFFTREADKERDRANSFVGAPADTGSAWSFDRWANAGPGRDPGTLQALYVGDRDAFYNLIVRDPSYLDGWRGPQPQDTRADFQHLRDLSDGETDRARWSERALWFNHLTAAFDALRAARIHNLPIRRNYELQLKSSWHRGEPTVTAALERRF